MMRWLVVLVCTASLVACVKKPGEKEKKLEDYGPEISEEAWKAQVNEDWDNRPDPFEIREGDSALLVHQQEIERQTVTLDKTLSRVIKRTETDKDIRFDWMTTREEWRNGSPVRPTTDKGYDATIDKPAATALGRLFENILKPFGIQVSFFTESRASSPDVLRALAMIPRMSTRAAVEGDTKISLHNFKREPIRVKIPDLARQNPNCGRRTPGGCDVPISGQRLSWDRIESKDGKVLQKYSFMRIVSNELPYFIYESPYGGGFDYFYMQCVEGIVDIQTQKVHLIDCWSLADFALSAPPATP